jgi:hypothetical protein
MAFTPNRFLTEPTNVTLRDWQHAARLFTDDQFRLAPKHKFLFGVVFKLNKAALLNQDLALKYGHEIGMLVKNVDLPNYQITTETLNQYNRKKNIQTTIKYQPITMTFHDDNMGLINMLWKNYFNYYYADPSSAADAGAYDRTAMKNFNYIQDTYGLDNGSTDPFFESMTIFHAARHEFVSYKLINPIITQWNHNKVDYAQNTVHDNTATIAYESVVYDTGVVGDFTTGDWLVDPAHYDQTPSPLQGGSDPGAVVPSVNNTAGITNNAAEFLNNSATAINNYQNTQSLGTAAQTGLLTNTIATAQQSVSGVQGIAFPVSTNTNATVANKINIV